MLLRRSLPLAASALLGLLPAAGRAAPTDLRTVAIEWGTYLPGDSDYPELRLEVPQGGRLTLVNADHVMGVQEWGAHTLTEEIPAGSGDEVRFTSEQLAPGEAGDVAGIETLDRGTYAFSCATHGNTMRGTLTIV